MKTVSDYLRFSREVIYVDSSASIEAIQTRMIANEVSHIPIIDNNGKKNIGLVRRKNIWLWMLKNGGKVPSVKDVKEDPLPVVKIDEPITSAMKKLNGTSAVLILGSNKCYSHFLSPRVVAKALECYSERFQVIEKLENKIRKRLEKIPNKDLARGLNLDVVKIEDLTFSQYHTAFSNLWDMLDFKYLDKKRTLGIMESVRKYRNGVMHFRLDADDEKELASAKKLMQLLQET